MKAKLVIFLLLVSLLLLMTAAPASAKMTSRTYRASLTELNGSGVVGTVAITKLPGMIKVSVWASGLVPRKEHAQHIHGFADGGQAMVPGAAADTNGDGFIQLNEAVATAGPVLLALTPYPRVNTKRNQFYVFTKVYRGSALSVLDPFETPLEKRVVMVHGGYWSPAYGLQEYDALLPVAAGRIVANR